MNNLPTDLGDKLAQLKIAPGGDRVSIYAKREDTELGPLLQSNLHIKAAVLGTSGLHRDYFDGADFAKRVYVAQLSVFTTYMLNRATRH